ncbi:helix-turn-helix transcriptional regulator [Pontibacter sp. CAU 1760]
MIREETTTASQRLPTFKAAGEPTNTNASALPQEELIKQKIAGIDAVADELPCVVIIHNMQAKMRVEYISPRGERELGMSLEKIKALGPHYHTTFFNPEDAQDYLPKVTAMVEKNDDAVVSFFQQVRESRNSPWRWHMSTAKVLMRDKQGQPLLSITLAYPIDPLHHVTSKVSRLLEENNFLRANYHKYSRLSERELEVLKGLALGQTAAESADLLHISVATIETHRRNIKKKLETNAYFDLT